MIADSKSVMHNLRWMSIGGVVLILLGLIVTGGNQAAGLIIGLLGIAILIGVGYVSYDLGKSGAPKA